MLTWIFYLLTPALASTLSCDLATLSKQGLKPIYGASTETLMTSESLVAPFATDDFSYSVTVESGMNKPNADRGYRILLNNKRAGAIGHLDGTLSELKMPGGVLLRLIDGPAKELRIHCSLR